MSVKSSVCHVTQSPVMLHCVRSLSALAGLDMEEDFLLIGQNFTAVFHEVNKPVSISK